MKIKTQLAEAVAESNPNDMFAGLSKPFKGLKAGDTVYFKQYAGMGRGGPEYKTAKGKVLPHLVFSDHVMVSGGWAGQLVNDENFIKKG